jgi:hypothetical protein
MPARKKNSSGDWFIKVIVTSSVDNDPPLTIMLFFNPKVMMEKGNIPEKIRPGVLLRLIKAKIVEHR